MKRSITYRLALLFALVSGVTFLALGIYVAAAIERHFEEIDRAELVAAVDHVKRILEASQGQDTEALRRRLGATLAGHDQVARWLVRDSGERLLWDESASFPKELAAREMAATAVGHERLFVWHEEGRLLRGLATRLPLAGAREPPLKMWAALDIEHHERFMALFERALWAAITAAIVLSGLLGLVIARTGMAPVRTMAAHAQRISTARLEERIDTRALPNELLDLANAFNDMLGRLHDSFRRLSEFSADIAHELRTPVCNLLTETQVMLTKGRSVDEYREVLASNAEELEHLRRMIADMLFLAKTDNGLTIPNREPVELGTEVRDLFDFYDALAEEKSLSLTVTGNATVDGDRLMLRRAINNLVANAIRHTPTGGRVEVELKTSPGRVALTIDNTGEPIPAELLPRLFERFYRADEARHRATEGAGLGLAIARSIVNAHGGEITARSTAAGNSFTFWLPTSAAPDRTQIRPEPGQQLPLD